MSMELHSFLLVMVCGVVTAVLRALPFLLFPAGKETPPLIRYLSSVLPSAVMGMLVVYCLRNITPLQYSYGLPELIAIAVTVGLHLWKRQMLLSIAGGTVCYMLLVQLVF